MNESARAIAQCKDTDDGTADVIVELPDEIFKNGAQYLRFT